MIVAVALVVSVLLTELALEARDVARYMPGQTFATVGDARIRYRLLGAEHTGATVVFLSGLSGSIEQVDDIQRAVSSAVPSLAYDRAGYGFSQGSTAHSAEEQAKELAALLHALKLEEPVVLVAYSSSAPIARIFAGCFPEKTAGMYLIDPIWGHARGLRTHASSARPTAPSRALHRAPLVPNMRGLIWRAVCLTLLNGWRSRGDDPQQKRRATLTLIRLNRIVIGLSPG
jgi:pimeloyl-ACP methyl ester carboxylesterase